MEENVLKILGNSQTFVGVLLTLNVLCIFLDRNNNFIHALLQFSVERFKTHLLLLEKNLQKKINDFKGQAYYGKIKKLANSKSKKVAAEKKKEAQGLYFYMEKNIVGVKVTVSEKILEMESVGDYSEQVLGPLYCMGFAVILFMLDEICRFFPPTSVYPIFGINVITMLSSAYWLMIWITFFVHSKSIHEKSEADNWILRMDNKISKFGTAVVEMILCLVIYWLCLRFLPWNLMNSWGRVVLNIVAFILPITLIGLWRMCLSGNKGYFSYLHVLGHLVVIVMYALGITIIFALFQNIQESTETFMFNLDWMRLLSVTFLLCNGLLLPFIGPLIVCYIKFRKEKREREDNLNNIDKSIDSSIQQYNTLCQNIGENLLEQI